MITKTQKIPYLLINFLAFIFLFFPLFTSSQGTNPITSPTSSGINFKIDNPFRCGGNTTNCTLFDLITAILNNIVMPIAAVAVVVWIIWAGFNFLMAQGNPAKIDQAKQRLLWSLIGAGILLGAAGISTVVQNTVRALIAP